MFFKGQKFEPKYIWYSFCLSERHLLSLRNPPDKVSVPWKWGCLRCRCCCSWRCAFAEACVLTRRGLLNSLPCVQKSSPWAQRSWAALIWGYSLSTWTYVSNEKQGNMKNECLCIICKLSVCFFIFRSGYCKRTFFFSQFDTLRI